MYNVLRGRVSFANYVAGCPDDDDGSLFAVPPGYRVLAEGDEQGMSDDDRLLMLALQASLRENEYGGGDGSDAGVLDYDDIQLQRALAESLMLSGAGDEAAEVRRMMALTAAQTGHVPGAPELVPRSALAASYAVDYGGEDDDLRRALEASLAEQSLAAARPTTAEDEEEQMRLAIEASMKEQ